MSSCAIDKVLNINACRICLDSTIEESVNSDQENNLLKLLEYCAGLKVTSKDGPCVFCKNCTCNLQNFAQFKEKCLKSDTIWKSLTNLGLRCYADNASALNHLIKTEHASTDIECSINDKVVHDTQIDINNIKYTSEKNYEEINSVGVKNNAKKNTKTIKPYPRHGTKKYSKTDQNHDIKIKSDDDQINPKSIKDIPSCDIYTQIDIDKYDNSNDQILDTHSESDDYKEDILYSKAHPLIEEFDIININDYAQVKTKSGRRKKVKNENISVFIDGVFMCPKCNKKYVKEKFLWKHMKSECGQIKIKPKIKEIKTEEKSSYEPPNNCGICEFVSDDKTTLDRHVSEHYTDNDLDCKQCTYRAYDVAALMRHRYSHCLSNVKASKSCHLCDMTTKSALNLEYHYRSVHLGNPGGFCTICNKTFTVFTSWRKHELGHRNCKFTCHHCGKSFVYRSQIIDHIRLHSNVMDFICEECGKGFRRKSALQLHKSSVHYKSGPLKCSHCDKLFKTPITLSEHMKYIATSNKSFQCEVCNKWFASKYMLKKHLFWHTGAKPHCCDFCGSRYKAKGQLKIHLRTHTGERPYQCKQCIKSYKDIRLLKRHERTHTGDTKPFKCEHCARGFTTKGSLFRHRQVKHKHDGSKS